VIDMHLEIVRFALALHLGVDPHVIEPENRLEGDLGLDPLDLVLVALRLEEIEEGEFPVARLETVTTVADLVEIVRRWSTLPGTAEERETLIPPASAPPARATSGTRRAVSAGTVARLLPFARAAYR
jgi:acyl carrier protein